MQEGETNTQCGINLRLCAWWQVKVIQRGGRKRVREKERKIKNKRREGQGDRRSKSQ